MKTEKHAEKQRPAGSSSFKALLSQMCKESRRNIEKRLAELTAAHNISREIAASSELQKCLKALGDRVAELMSVEIVSLMLMDKNKTELVMKVGRGLEADIVDKAKVRINSKSVAGWIARTGKPLLIKDIRKDKRFPRRGGRYTTESLLSAPLKIGDKIIGVINVNNKSDGDVFRKEDLEILRTVADMASIAIENAHVQEEARLLDKMKTDFIANVSHELRTPLAVIKESIGLIFDGITGSVNNKQKKFLELARKNIERLGGMIDGMLDLARIDAQKASTKRVLIDITTVAKDVVSSLAMLARSQKIKLKTDIPARHIKLWGDEEKLARIMTNLIGNAIKYNKPAGSAQVILRDMKEEVIFSVSDTGIGIPDEEKDRLFDRFKRVEMAARGQTKSTGLGLAITKELVDIHGGEIFLESKLGKGSIFTVRMPKDLRRSR